MKFVYVRLSGGQVGQSRFSHAGGPVKLAEASLYTRKDVESTLHCCGSLVKLVHGCLNVRKDLYSSFHQCGGHVKHVQAT